MDNGKDAIIWRPESDRKTTRLIIVKDKKGTARHKPTDVVVETRQLAISRRFVNYAWQFYNVNNLKNTDQFEFDFLENGKLKKVNLPEKMVARLKGYLTRISEITDKYDCADFAHELNGVEFTHADYDPEKWVTISYFGNLKPGDTILMKKSSDTNPKGFDHFAVYLDDGLFLSKHGTIGPLIVTGLEEMKKLFESDTVYQVTPKTQYVTK